MPLRDVLVSISQQVERGLAVASIADLGTKTAFTSETGREAGCNVLPPQDTDPCYDPNTTGLESKRLLLLINTVRGLSFSCYNMNVMNGEGGQRFVTDKAMWEF